MTGVDFEQVVLIMFAGGPGLAALVVQYLTRRADREAEQVARQAEREAEQPMRDASAAQVLVEASDQIMKRMQTEIDDLRDKLQAAETEIAELRGRLEAAVAHAEQEGRLREQLDALTMENARLRAKLPDRHDDDPGGDGGASAATGRD